MTLASSDFRQCAATTATGKQCRRVARPGSDYCFSHRKQPAGKVKERHSLLLVECDDCGVLHREQDLFPALGDALLCHPCARLRRALVALVRQHFADRATVNGAEISSWLAYEGASEAMINGALEQLRAEGAAITAPSRNCEVC